MRIALLLGAPLETKRSATKMVALEQHRRAGARSYPSEFFFSRLDRLNLRTEPSSSTCDCVSAPVDAKTEHSWNFCSVNKRLSGKGFPLDFEVLYLVQIEDAS
ncbi:hypothetical protein GOB05_04290 [Sinorhizobium meliloti]|nr:hypothetical protein [Sinorhizobium meliloti]